MKRATARRVARRLFVKPCFVAEARAPSRRAIAASSNGGPRFQRRPIQVRGTSVSASSSRGILVSPGGGRRRSSAWEVRSSPARERRVLLRFMTPHEAPSDERDSTEFKGAGTMGITFYLKSQVSVCKRKFVKSMTVCDLKHSNISCASIASSHGQSPRAALLHASSFGPRTFG